MIKKRISDFLNGEVKISKFSDIQDNENKVYKIILDDKNNKVINLYVLQDVRIVISGHTCFSVLKNNRIIEELCFQSKNLIRKSLSSNKVISKGYITLFPKKIKGTSFCLLQDVSQKRNYWHFLYDCIVKLRLVDSLKEINVDKILIPSTKQIFQKQIIQALDIEDKIIDCDGLNVIDLEKLIIVDHPYWQAGNSWFEDTKQLPFWSVKFLRNKFANLQSKKIFKKKIFIDRSESSSPNNQIHNLLEVKNFLSSKNFDILQFSYLNFEDQISAFRNADTIVGAHGAAFANAAFSKPKINLIEIKQKDHNVTFDNIYKANDLNFKIWRIEANREGKMFVDIKKLEKYI